MLDADYRTDTDVSTLTLYIPYQIQLKDCE